MYNKDIALLLKSRNKQDNKGLEKMAHSINMLYSTCESKDNFDIIGIIDSDQIEIYKPIIEQHPEIIWLFPEPSTKGGWDNLIRTEYDFINANDYYFVWPLVDDFWGLKENWDRYIIDKKSIFKDNIFSLTQSNPSCHGRHPWIFEKHYIIDNDKRWSDTAKKLNEPQMIEFHCEMLPIHTKKWFNYIYEILLNNVGTTQSDLLTAAILMILKKRYNIERLIVSDVYWKDAEDSGHTVAMSDQSKNPSKSALFHDIAKNDWEYLNSTINKIKQDIDDYSKTI
jgi:hypothetical protein